MTRPSRFTVPAALDGERLDRCLASLQDRWTRSRIHALIAEGHVLVDGIPKKPAASVHAGAVIEVEEPDPEPSRITPEPIALDIIFEDEHILVLDKPAGLVIHPAAGNPAGTLVNALLYHCTDLSGIGGVERPGIVHRLDKDTTGLLVVAKTDSAHRRLSLAFRRREIHKTYLAVCYGIPDPPSGTIDAPIARHPRERKRMAVRPSGRPAQTIYSVRERFDGAALITCRLITGRTHQIRVHMAHAGHALVGDPLYAGRQWKTISSPEIAAACKTFHRQALHSWRLELIHPINGTAMTFEAPLPRDIQALLSALRTGSS